MSEVPELVVGAEAEGGGRPAPARAADPAAAKVAAPRLSFAPIASISRLPAGERWLVDGFLSSSSLTVLAATPKAGKTWVCLALATAVATGTQALGRFQVASRGSVLVFPAEDDPRSIRERIESLCAGQHVELTDDFAVDVITAESLKLDQAEDREKLEELIALRQPKLLILDPLVRLHSGSESSASHMAELFGYLRRLQRRFQLAILVTHHVSKNRTGATQPGQAMRGSGDIHAAYDHGATLTRQDDGSVLLTIEHRAAPSPDPMAYRLVSAASGGMTFEFFEPESEDDEAPSRSRRAVAPRASRGPAAAPPPEARPLVDVVLGALREAAAPVSQSSLRKRLRVRNESLTQALRSLETQGLIESLGRMGGWRVRMAPDASGASADALA